MDNFSRSFNTRRPEPRRLSRRAFLTLCGAAAAGAYGGPALALGREDLAEPEVIPQTKVGEAACGPCALANALAGGDAAGRRAFRQLAGGTPEDRVQTLITRYGAKPSETYGPRRGRFSPDAGLTATDMPFLANDVFAASGLPRARGDFLDARPGEEARAHLHRVHGLLAASLARGLPPVVEVRAFSADPTASKGTMSWVNLYAHWLALVSVEPSDLPEKAGGFSCRFADSFTGGVIPGFAYAELYRPFNATRGFALRADGTKDWRWLTGGHPYVLLDLPDLPLTIQTRPWHERTFVALTYAVCRGA